MGNYFPLVGFSGMRDDTLANKVGIILLAMQGNTRFLNPSPSLTDVEAALDDFRLKLETAGRKGSPMDTTLKKQSRTVLMALLKRLGRYVEEVAAGDLAVIQSSGFTSSADAVPGTVPGTPQYVVVAHGKLSGELKLSFQAVKEALLYEYRYAVLPVDGSAPEWSDRLTTGNSRAAIISGLTRATEYLVQVRAVNSHGAGDWSQSVAQVAL